MRLAEERYATIEPQDAARRGEARYIEPQEAARRCEARYLSSQEAKMYSNVEGKILEVAGGDDGFQC